MRKILVHVETRGGDKFIEIVNLNRVWTTISRVGIWALMYSDDKYEYNVLGYSSNYSTVDSAREKLVEAYTDGKSIVKL